MPFSYSFPFFYHVERPYKREAVFEVRDASDRLVRRVSAWASAVVTDTLNEPSKLELTVLASDASVEALSGGNEIWIVNHEQEVIGKYRLAAGGVVKSHDSGGAFVQVQASSYTSLLGEEVTWNWQLTGTVTELVAEILARQIGERPVTAGIIPDSIGLLSRTIQVGEQQTLLETLRNLVNTIEVRAMFWVDNDRVLQWLDLDAVGDSGKHLTVEKNLSSVQVEVDWSKWLSRVYAYGEKASNGRYLVLGDGDQGWDVWKSSAGAGYAVLDHTHAGCSDPSNLTGYAGAVPSVQAGDRLKIGANEVELTGATEGPTSTTVTWRGTYNPGSGAAKIKLRRNYLDSPLYGCEFYKVILVDPAIFTPMGEAAYALNVVETDDDIAALAAKAGGRTARVFFLDEDGQTVLASTVTTLDIVTGEIDATVTVPKASGVRETAVYMVLGWA